MAEWLLALDVGTTSCKAAALTPTGQLLASAVAGYPVQRPMPGWVEQNPDDWWNAARTAVRRVTEDPAVRTGRLCAVGLSGMATTHVIVDSAGRVLRPAILWQDIRAVEEAAELAGTFGSPAPEDLFGASIPMTASVQASRMLWLAKHEPETLSLAAAIIGSKDYLAYRLTGELSTDITSCLGLANLKTGEIHRKVAAATGVDPGLFPRRLAPREVAGEVSRQAAGELGLPHGIPVASGMIDSWCNMLGVGLDRPGMGWDTAGTAEVVGVTSARPPSGGPPKGLSALPFVTGVAVVYGVTQSGCDSFEWFTQAFGEAETAQAGSRGTTAYRLLDELAATSPPGARGLLFLPYLSGERSPVFDPHAAGVFMGIRREHTRADFTRAVLEGVAFSVRHVLEASESITGLTADRILVSSGGAKSCFWNQVKADVTGRVFATLAVTDAGSVGAAMLAALACGHMSTYGEAVATMVHVRETLDPRSADHEVYTDLFDTYKLLHPRLKELFPRLRRATENVPDRGRKEPR
ncbi:MAG: FGGY family carbohydrate kinase [bacterium]|nr:FGGY family carbohydrate kinase [bacterium]